MKMLRWSFAHSAMLSNNYHYTYNSHLNWSFWLTMRNWLVSGEGDLVLRHFLDFVFVVVKFPFLIFFSSLLLIATRAGWGGITQRIGTDSANILAWASIRRNKIYISYVFFLLSYFLKDQNCHRHYLSSYFRLKLLWDGISYSTLEEMET